MTFSELKAQVYRDTGYPVSPGTVIDTRFGAWINEAHRHILRRPSMTNLRQGTLQFSSAASQSIYGLPQAFESMDAIMQQSNNLRLRMLTRDQYRLVDPGERSNGTPYAWVPVGLVPVMQQPASTGIWVVSTSALDATQILTLTGIVATGDEVAPAVGSLNGTTRAAVGALTTYVTVLGFSLSAVCVGDVSIYDAAASGNLLARIPAGATSVQYQGIRLWPTPGAVMTYTVDGQFEIPALINDNDVPLVPPSYHDLLSAYARFREYERTEDPRYPTAKAEFDEGVERLEATVEFPPDWHPVTGGTLRSAQWSNLGGWFVGDGWGRP